MCSTNALRVALIALSVSAVGQANIHAGSYSWAARGGDGLSLVDYDLETGDPIFTKIPPPTSILVQIDYDPTSLGYISSHTSGDRTTYDASSNELFSFLITGEGSPDWPNFQGLRPDYFSIVAPPPGGAGDSIEFGAYTDYYAYGYIEIYAPNGTLSTPTQLPTSLTAFRGGYFEFDGTYGYGGPPYTSGLTDGILSSVPEPSTLALLSISMSLVAGAAAFRTRNPGKVPRGNAAEAV